VEFLRRIPGLQPFGVKVVLEKTFDRQESTPTQLEGCGVGTAGLKHGGDHDPVAAVWRRRMTIGFSLEPKSPFRLDLKWALRRRPSNAVDRDGQTYRRVLMLNGKPCEVAMTQIAAPNSPRVPVAITWARPTPDVKTVTTSSLERLLGMRIDLTEFYLLAARDANLGPLVERFRGLNLNSERAVERTRLFQWEEDNPTRQLLLQPEVTEA
jgi:hypothetical protein